MASRVVESQDRKRCTSMYMKARVGRCWVIMCCGRLIFAGWIIVAPVIPMPPHTPTSNNFNLLCPSTVYGLHSHPSQARLISPRYERERRSSDQGYHGPTKRQYDSVSSL